MIVISARSPYIISINQANQTSSKVELYIYNKGTAIPTIPSYTLSEPIASVTQIETTYNISDFILEYINQTVMVDVNVPTVANNNDWCLCIVKRYATVSGTESLLTTETFVCVNGYTSVDDGVNLDVANGNNYLILSSNPYNKVYRYKDFIPNYNFIANRRTDSTYNVSYYDKSNALVYTNAIIASGSAEIFNIVIPLYYGTSVKLTIGNSVDGNYYTIYTEEVEECKYTPVTCSFVNRYGGWQQLVFFKAQTNSIAIKGSEYNLMQENWNYEPTRGQRKSFNINGTKTIKLNTGFIEESYNEIIQELLLSDRVLLDNLPVSVKTQSLTFKTHSKDKNINYELDFDYANNLLNDVK